ncbi:PH domain-containing protein [Rhodococcus sp. NPDC058521]|uniref:PH domain-containing protein n=1 Tax=Rhodococcus sp. NPDC058521 TaxID=3346536 RepID=UPI003661C3A0
MGYPEDALAEDEELLLHCHPHWKMLIVPAGVFVLSSAIAGFGFGLAGSKLTGTPSTVAMIAIAVLWCIVVALRAAGPFIRWKFTHFIVTDRRVLIREGVLTHTGIDIPMGRISNVQFRHGLLDRIVRTGTLVIASASDDPLEFDDIPHVQRVHALLYNEVFDAMDPHRDSLR